MNVLVSLAALALFPGGLFVVVNALAYDWAQRKLLARLQDRVGPRWFQQAADLVKLLAKEEIVPRGAQPALFLGLPIVALAAVLTAAVYAPIAGLAPVGILPGDLVIVVALLSAPTLCLGLAGVNAADPFARLGATRTLTQLFACEAPFLLALLGPAMLAGSWEIGEVSRFAGGRLLALSLPLGFVVALLGLVGKLELPPLDAPEAETEIVSGATTEYSGRGLALFQLARAVELVVGLALVAAFYLGGTSGIIAYLGKTLLLLALLTGARALLARLRIDQTLSVWWRGGALLVLLQILATTVWQGLAR